MEIKSYLAIEVEKNNRKYMFYMPTGASYGEVYDAAFEVLQKTVDLAQKAVDATKPPVDSQESQ